MTEKKILDKKIINSNDAVFFIIVIHHIGIDDSL